MDLAKIVEIAEAEAAANVREVGGPNRGERVQLYQRAIGMAPGSPWCAAFVAWIVREASGEAKAPPWATGSAVSNFFNAQAKLRGSSSQCLTNGARFAPAGFGFVRPLPLTQSRRGRNAGRVAIRGSLSIPKAAQVSPRWRVTLTARDRGMVTGFIPSRKAGRIPAL